MAEKPYLKNEPPSELFQLLKYVDHCQHSKKRHDSRQSIGRANKVDCRMNVQCWQLSVIECDRHEMRTEMETTERMLKWFEFKHVQSHLKDTSKMFHSLATDICKDIEPGPERTVALRKLLEAKDAAVRAKMNPGG